MTTTDTETAATTMPATITISPLSATIGAEISGVDLGEPPPEEQLHELRQALLDWKVIFFRDQDITTEQHLAFARNFGELEIHPFGPPHPEHPEIVAITHGPDVPGYENQWHADVTWRRDPPLGSVLRMKQIPPLGGDTLFADMYAAYDGLPDEIKGEIDGKVARHDFDIFRRALVKKGAEAQELAEFDARYPHPHHPVVRTHPETGRRTLFVNTSFTREIVGMDPARSDQLLNMLYQQATFPEYQCRFHWEPNSIAFWDNRSCQHYAVSDYWPHPRSAERATIIGDVPYFDPDQPVTADQDQSPFRGAMRRSIDRQAAALNQASR
jgi:taurine dioxygenase